MAVTPKNRENVNTSIITLEKETNAVNSSPNSRHREPCALL